MGVIGFLVALVLVFVVLPPSVLVRFVEAVTDVPTS